MAFQAYPYEMAAHVLVEGEDASDFLQSQFSNDLRPFSEGQVTYGLWLDVKGKIVADSWVRCEGEEQFRIFSERCSGQEIADKLNQHIIADDVELEVLPAASAVAVLGAESMDGGIVFEGRRSAGKSVEIVFLSAAERDAFVSNGDFEIVSESWIHEQRLRAGFPMIPQEIGPADLPGEASLTNDAVSLTKGCFLGQEVVARMHNVGRAQRSLFLVSGAGPLPDLPSPLENTEGKKVGELRSAFESGRGWLGVAIIKIRYAEPETELFIDDAPVQLGDAFRKEHSNG